MPLPVPYQTTELLALINLAELGTYMEIGEDALLTALEDFEHALKDFDRLLRALVISISKYVVSILNSIILLTRLEYSNL